MTEAAAPAPSPSSSPFIDRVREFFTLAAAERAVKALPEGPRTAAQRSLAIAFQKRDAAETLWPRGSCAEALQLARASVDTAAAALEAFDAGASDGRRPWVAEAQAVAAAAKEKVNARALPEIESEARPEDEETFRLLVDASLAMQRIVGPHLVGEGELKQLRRSRLVSAAVAGVIAVGLLAWALHVPDFKSATASGPSSSEDAGPDKLIDGDTKTDFYFPNNQLGWVELTLTRPKRVRALRVMGINTPWNDRGIKDAHVRCYYGGAVAKEADASFPVPQPRGTATDVWTEIPIDAKCDRVQIEAKSFYGQGVGIGEVELK